MDLISDILCVFKLCIVMMSSSVYVLNQQLYHFTQARMFYLFIYFYFTVLYSAARSNLNSLE